MELQSLTFAMKIENHALLDAKRDLEEQVRRQEEWEREVERYHPQALAAGVFAYALDPDAAPTEPAHLLCANCYQQRRKSILQRIGKTASGTTYRCHGCDAEIRDHGDTAPPRPQGISTRGG